MIYRKLYLFFSFKKEMDFIFICCRYRNLSYNLNFLFIRKYKIILFFFNRYSCDIFCIDYEVFEVRDYVL